MISHRALGIIILVIGVILLAFGINAAHSVTESTVEGVTGKYTSGTMWYIIGGVILVIIGCLTLFRKKP